MDNLRQINLNSLRVVESAARTGSFVRAAEEQLITPSAVSQRVKNLEAQLKFKIFNRRNNSVVLTSEGDAFMAHVKDALDTILAAGLEATGDQRQQTLKISALPTFIIRWLLQRIPDFNSQHSELNLNISHSYHPVDFAMEDVDVAIRYGDGHFPGLESRLLFIEQLTPVCSRGLLERVCNDHGIDDLTPEHLQYFTLLHSDTCALNWRSWLMCTGSEHVLDLAQKMNFDSCMMTIEAAHAGAGFTVGSIPYIAKDIDDGRLVAPFRTKYESGQGFYLVYPKRYKEQEKVRAFEAWITEEAQQSDARISEKFS